MTRSGPAWLIFAFCVALAAAAIVRVGQTALSLERAEAKARRQAALEENLQLALWRMDSAVAPLIAEESARPYFSYSPLYPAERAFTNMFAEIQRGDVLAHRGLSDAQSSCSCRERPRLLDMDESPQAGHGGHKRHLSDSTARTIH